MIPHAGSMCLLDGVLHWDETEVRCISATHRAADNPLRRGGRLPAACGVEYAAQAMATHGGLLAATDGRRQTGYLASIRDLVLRCDRLDLLSGDLVIDAERLLGNEGRAVYRFRIRCEDAEMLSGRAAVVLAADRA
jgi:predicted hotdog family 3-hydroxylacyl-ACP dehydratase